jgi:hypothetical protein
MKKCIILLLSAIVLFSCNSVKVTSDYDSKVNFKSYKTFAFYKPEIDRAKISDLDKKRILRAIEGALLEKGFTKSNAPDMLVGIFAKSREKVNINQNQNNQGFGWRWNPWMMNGLNSNIQVSQFSEGTLFIDFIDTTKKELIWQGVGSGALKTQNREKKEIRIKEFVAEIMTQFPPESNGK